MLNRAGFFCPAVALGYGVPSTPPAVRTYIRQTPSLLSGPAIRST